MGPTESPGDVFVDPDEELPQTKPDSSERRRGLLQRQVTCPEGGTTSVSGTVYIPSGALPLYNVMVYVPDGELQPLTPGASCSCEVTGAPLVSTITDASGRFVLSDVPVGDEIPLVIQVGDWRREFNIGTVTACADNPIEDQTLRLPSNKSEGNLPRIAVVTGQLDALECLVRKLGVDDSEFTAPGEGGSVSLYAGEQGTASFLRDASVGDIANKDYGSLPSIPPASELSASAETLSQYDVVLFSCGGRDLGEGKDASDYQAMFDYVNAGGRMFASHYQSIWFQQGPAPFPELGTFFRTDEPDLNDVSARVITTFPKGQAMADWLVATGKSEVPGELLIRGAQHSLDFENPEYAQRWIATEEPATTQYISANTPLGASDEEQCGRVVFSDIHVSPGTSNDDVSDVIYPFPSGCITSEFSPQEAVLAFMLFDLSACIIPDSEAPVAPGIIR